MPQMPIQPWRVLAVLIPIVLGGCSSSRHLPAATSYDPGDCMYGMDMPHCSAEQAQRLAANQSKVDPRILPRVLITLQPDGSSQSSEFPVPSDAMHLLISVRLAATAPAYAATGPGGTTDLQLQLGPEKSQPLVTIQLNGTSRLAGADPATVATLGPFNATLNMPPPGRWTASVIGQGTGIQIQISLVDRLVM